MNVVDEQRWATSLWLWNRGLRAAPSTARLRAGAHQLRRAAASAKGKFGMFIRGPLGVVVV